MTMQMRFRILSAAAFTLLALSMTCPSFGAETTRFPPRQPTQALTIPYLPRHVRPGTDLSKAALGSSSPCHLFHQTRQRRARRSCPLGLTCSMTVPPFGSPSAAKDRTDRHLKADAKNPDDFVWRDDSVDVFLATDRGRFHFVVNSIGTLYGASKKESDRSIKLRPQTTVDDQGWTAVINIPFSALRTKRAPGRRTLADEPGTDRDRPDERKPPTARPSSKS